jgi:ATP-dependent protease ClpP protease subunit
MSAGEARDYGMIDQVVATRAEAAALAAGAAVPV